MKKIKEGDLVKCLPTDSYVGAGHKTDLIFEVIEITTSFGNPKGNYIYFGGEGGCGVYSNYVEKVANCEEIKIYNEIELNLI